jgi:hypothetical protein
MKNILKSSSINEKNWWKILFFTLLGLAVSFRWVDHGWEKIVDSDGRGYYAYLPAIFSYHDLDFRYFFTGRLDVPIDYTTNFLFIIDGHYVIKYPPGVAVMLIPFYGLATLFSLLFGFEMNGYSFFYQIMVSLGAIFYCILGLRWMMELLKRMGVTSGLAIAVSVTMLFGTNLLNYVIHEPSMSHVYSFAAIAGFLVFIKRFIDSAEKKQLLYAAIALGLIILIRSVNGVIIFAVLFFFHDFQEIKKFVTNLFSDWTVLVKCVVAIVVIAAIQPFLWYLQNGHWFVWTYLGETFRWESPEILKVLFSYRKGWLVYTPFMLLLFPAFFYILYSRSIFRITGFLLFWVLLVYIISSWWCWYYGGSFGQRAFIEFYPVAGMCFSPMLVKISKGKTIHLLSGVMFICVILNLIQSYQYKYHILHYDSMDKAKYWSVFLKTGKQYEWMVFINPNEMTPDELKEKVVMKSFNDFESCGVQSEWNPCKSDYSESAVSGNHVAEFGGEENSYSPMYKKLVTGVSDTSVIFFRGYVNKSDLKGSTNIVIAIDDSSGKNIYQYKVPLNQILASSESSNENFKMISSTMKLPMPINNKTLVVYLIAPDQNLKLDDVLLLVCNK